MLYHFSSLDRMIDIVLVRLELLKNIPVSIALALLNLFVNTVHTYKLSTLNITCLREQRLKPCFHA